MVPRAGVVGARLSCHRVLHLPVVRDRLLATPIFCDWNETGTQGCQTPPDETPPDAPSDSRVAERGNPTYHRPAIGRLMTELIDASENGHDHDADPLQVRLHHVDVTLNTGIFSRNREIIQGSTFSVLG